ncbi:MAG: DMT family transporter [Planctomycetia bacterium]|nr:DMT family transporter [Planctomycetia bacterium]
MNQPALEPRPELSEVTDTHVNKRLSDAALGTLLCILSDTIFSFSYFFVRWLTTFPEVHRDWTFCFKELITTAGALPIFLYMWFRGKCAPPPVKIIFMIIIAAFFCEFVGVRSHIVTFTSLGMMLGNPLIRTFTILGTALIGLIILREKLTSLKLATMTILIVAIFILGFSQAKPSVPVIPTGDMVATVDDASAVKGSDLVVIPVILTPCIEIIQSGIKSIFGTELTPVFIFGFGMALLTGVGYALYTIILRYILRKAASDDKAHDAKKEPIPIFFIVAAVCGFGAVVGGLFLYKDRGWDGFVQVPRICWLLVFLAGALNVVCFYLKNLSLRYATASKVAIFSVLQIFLATLLGILFFKEPTNTLIWAGLSLTVLGIILAGKTK